MRVDFYQLGGLPVERALSQLAEKAMGIAERLLIVSGDDDQLARISDALWNHSPTSFLAHGRDGDGMEPRQPILLSRRTLPVNGARIMAIADGIWREGEGSISRTLYLFDEATIAMARECWRALARHDGVERRFWKRKAGNWVEGP
ncbi:MAG: DNA polymerase III subunit chi [Novosphingobium sp.]|nr:DNA polymerase III subunit chi [Novosphingobium sp.]